MPRRASAAPSARAASAYAARTPTFEPQKTHSRRTGRSARRAPEVPLRDALEPVSGGEEGLLAEGTTHELEPDRAAVAGEAAWESERGKPGQIERRGEAADGLHHPDLDA